MAKKKNKKIATPNITIDGSKTPKIRENPESYFNWKPSWCFSKCDFNHGKWTLQKSDMFSDIIPKLVSFESRTWGEIVSDKKHNHWISTESLAKEAQNRMVELNLYYDELFSLRLTGEMRCLGTLRTGYTTLFGMTLITKFAHRT